MGGDRTELVSALAGAIEAARKGRVLDPVTVVTPSVFSSFYLRRALGADGLFNVRFSRLDDLAEVLAPASGLKPPLTRLIAAELVAAVVADRTVPLARELDQVRDHPSMAAAVHRTLDALETAPAGKLDEIAAIGPVQASVVALTRAYRARATGYEHRIDVASRAAAAVHAGPTLVAERLGAIVFLDVEPTSRPYRGFADALKATPGAAAVSGATLSRPPQQTSAKPISSPESEIPENRYRICRGAYSGSVSDRTGGDGDRAIGRGAEENGGPDAKLVSAPDPAAEVQWVVRNSMRLAREGLRFGDIAVFYDDPAYGLRLEEAFRLAGVPVSGPDPARFADRPEGRFLLGALECLALAASGQLALRRDAVMAWLTGAPVLPPQARESFHASRWDAVSRNAGVVRGLESWRTSLSGYADRLGRRALATLNLDEIDASTAAGIRAEAEEARALLAFVEELARRARPPRDGAPWSEFAAWGRRLTTRYLASVAVDNKAWLEAFFDRVEQLDSVGSAGPTFERFSAVVREELSRPMRSNRTLGRGVFIAPLAYAPGTSFEAVHVVGMAEGRFPASPAHDALLPEEVRLQVDRDGEWLENRETDRERQRARYTDAIDAGRRLFLLWPRAEPGATRRSWPAQWFVEAARVQSGDPTLQASALLRQGAGERPDGRNWLEVVANAHDAASGVGADACADEYEYDLRSTIAWRRNERRVEEHFLARMPESGIERGVRLARSRFSEEWTEFDGNLTSRPGGGSTFDEPVSPTRLEAWAACPFRHFLAYVLRLTALPRPEEALMMAPMDQGALMHSILQDYFVERSGPAVDEDRRAVMTRVAGAALDAAPARYVVGKPALWAFTREQIERSLLEFVAKESERETATGLRQTQAELRFGLRGAHAPPVRVRVGDGRELVFRGVIDRVEISRDGTRGAVIDYKTGSPKVYGRLDEDPVDRGKRLQLPVYADALRALEPRLESVTAQYWFVGAKGGFTMLPDGGIGDSGPMLQVANVIAGGIDAGIFVARPGPRSDEGFANCMFCAFDRVCPGARDRIWERKRDDPGVARYRELAEPASDGSGPDDGPDSGKSNE